MKTRMDWFALVLASGLLVGSLPGCGGDSSDTEDDEMLADDDSATELDDDVLPDDDSSDDGNNNEMVGDDAEDDTVTSCQAQPTETLVYDATDCSTNVALPRSGAFFQYDDGTGEAPSAGAEPNGRDGEGDCAFHTVGSEYSDWGAGVGFDVCAEDGAPVAHDASAYAGLRFYAMGAITGTRTDGYQAGDGHVHVKFVTSTNRGDDEYGMYCPIEAATWTECVVPFDSVTREGWNTALSVADDVFDPERLLKILFEFSDLDTDDPSGVVYDVYLDDIEFYVE